MLSCILLGLCGLVLHSVSVAAIDANVNLIHYDTSNVLVKNALTNGVYGSFCSASPLSGQILYLSVENVGVSS